MQISLRSVFVASALASVVFASCSPATVSSDGGADAAKDASAVNDSGSDQASCNGLGDTCGPNGNESCCSVAAVAGGTFIRDYDGVDSATKPYVDTSHTATLSAFTLDTYPVTIGRFRKFFELYPASLPQHDGDGKNPNNPDDPGWSMSWNALMPATAAELDKGIFDAATSNTCSFQWRDRADGGKDDFPITCATWYEAFAFCIWDGGRLPTSAEYNYAQSGGAEQRYYPWSNPPDSQTIDDTLTVFNSGAMAVVGSTPPGNGKFGQADLNGDVNQWVLDTNPVTDSELPGLPATCKDCALFDAGPNRAFRGSNWQTGVLGFRSVLNFGFAPATRGFSVGFRCARN